MAKTEIRPPAHAGEQTIEQLQRRYQDLNTKKIQAETQRDGAAKRLAELKAQALEKYGTDDVGRLKERLTEIITENAAKRAKYQEDLDKIDQGLAAVEARFSESGSSTGDGGQLRK
jgi:predicted transcriptional regulator